MLEPIKNFQGISVTTCTTYACNLACKYDLIQGSKVLMADFTEKNIENVVPGDKIIAFDEHAKDGKRNFVVATVIASGVTRALKEAYRYYTSTGVELIASGEHPVLNTNDGIKEEFIKTADLYKMMSSNNTDDKPNTFKLAMLDTNIGGNTINIDCAASTNVECELRKIEFDEPKQFYNMTTSSATYIANGILVHNCYEINKRNVTIPIDYAKKFIDIILDDPDPIGVTGTEDEWMLDHGIIIDFIGGDSFMNPEIIDEVLTYFVQQCVIKNHRFLTNWRASISSNGTLFENKAVRDLIEKWKDNFSIGVSIDGCPEIHDKNRIMAARDKDGNEVGSMQYIMKWWPWVKENLPYTGSQTKATCSRESIPYLFESLRYMHEVMGMTHINQNFIMEANGCTDEDYMLLDEQFEKCKDYLLEHRDVLYWSMFDTQGINGRAESYNAHEQSLDKGWCGSGAMPSVGFSGKIYPCFRWLPHTMEQAEKQSDEHVVGDIWNGFNHKERFREVKEQTRRKISSEYCKVCNNEPACSYCIAGAFSEFNAFKRTEHICTITKLRAKWARIYWHEFEELDHRGGNWYSVVRDRDGNITQFNVNGVNKLKHSTK